MIFLLFSTEFNGEFVIHTSKGCIFGTLSIIIIEKNIFMLTGIFRLFMAYGMLFNFVNKSIHLALFV